MKIVLLVFVFLLICFILFVPIKIKCGAHLNLVKNKGFYCIKVAFVKLLCGRLQISSGKLEFENNNDLLFKSNKDEKYLNKIIINVLKKISIKEIELFVEFGSKNNAAATALVCGGMHSVFSAFFAVLKCRYENMYQFLDVDTNYNRDAFETTFSSVLSISLFEVLISLLKAKIEWRSENERRK